MTANSLPQQRRRPDLGRAAAGRRCPTGRRRRSPGDGRVPSPSRRTPGCQKSAGNVLLAFQSVSGRERRARAVGVAARGPWRSGRPASRRRSWCGRRRRCGRRRGAVSIQMRLLPLVVRARVSTTSSRPLTQSRNESSAVIRTSASVAVLPAGVAAVVRNARSLGRRDRVGRLRRPDPGGVVERERRCRRRASGRCRSTRSAGPVGLVEEAGAERRARLRRARAGHHVDLPHVARWPARAPVRCTRRWPTRASARRRCPRPARPRPRPFSDGREAQPVGPLLDATGAPTRSPTRTAAARRRCRSARSSSRPGAAPGPPGRRPGPARPGRGRPGRRWRSQDA